MIELKTFAVSVYSETGVAEACLTLQDENNVDVPLLLFCGWYGACYGRLPSEQLTLATGISRQLGAHLIKPLRQTRRWMKTHSVEADTEQRWNTLREEIKRAELSAELLMLDTLSAMAVNSAGSTGVNADKGADDRQTRLDIIRHNLSLILEPETSLPDTHEHLLKLISAACLDTARAL